MRKNIGFFLIILVIIASICLLYVNPGFLRQGAKKPKQPPAPPLSKKGWEEKVILYFPNKEYIQTGREDVPMMKAVDRVVKVEDNNLVAAILEELRKPPTGEGLTTALHDQIKVRATSVKERRAYVDFASENLHGGSLQETLLINQIVQTLTALPGIDEVQFLVDGEKRETLMGHLSIDQPFIGE